MQECSAAYWLPGVRRTEMPRRPAEEAQINCNEEGAGGKQVPAVPFPAARGG